MPKDVTVSMLQYMWLHLGLTVKGSPKIPPTKHVGFSSLNPGLLTCFSHSYKCPRFVNIALSGCHEDVSLG
jgi:hypothetical protein